jgi:hypothetical protein
MVKAALNLFLILIAGSTAVMVVMFLLRVWLDMQ